MRCFRGGDDFLVGRIRLAHYDILPDRARVKPCLLQHHTKTISQALARHIPDVYSIDPNTSTINIIEPHQQIYDSCFSAAGRSHDRHALAGLHLKVKILDQLLLRIV